MWAARGPSAPPGERGWSQGKPATVAGLVLEIRRRPNRVTLILDDRSARLEVSLFEETFQQYRDIIVKDAILIVDGMLRFDDFIEAWRLQAKTLWTSTGRASASRAGCGCAGRRNSTGRRA